jgi:hypothetical protein
MCGRVAWLPPRLVLLRRRLQLGVLCVAEKKRAKPKCRVHESCARGSRGCVLPHSALSAAAIERCDDRLVLLAVLFGGGDACAVLEAQRATCLCQRTGRVCVFWKGHLQFAASVDRVNVQGCL